MKSKLAFVLFSFALLIQGCASTDYDNYIKAQTTANEMQLKAQKPLVEIEAVEGQQITGLKALRVYAPQQQAVIQQSRPNEWAGVVTQAIGVVGTVGGIVAAGNAAVSLTKQVGVASTTGYQYIQAPSSTVNTTMSNSTGVLGSGAYKLDNTSTPTVVNQPQPVIVQQPQPVIVGGTQ